MKTTIDIDDRKLRELMRLTGIRSRKATVDYALSRAGEAERLRKLFEKPLPDAEYEASLDPSYDLMAVRQSDKPKARRHVAR
jgi:Arc/MetJ family transcription regulator